MDKEALKKVYRHSLAHVLAKAAVELFGKDTQLAIGPEIEDGFYYDFKFPRPLTNEDLKSLETKMREILHRKEAWTRRVVSKEEALKIFKGQIYKEEMIRELPEDETITTYATGDDFVDLCRGPHVENSCDLLNAAWQLRSMSGSYWRGDEKRDQLTRIYAYAFPTREELKQHLNFIKEAKERDHKKIGPMLDLFLFEDTAPGMPYWLPRGWKLFNALLNFWREVHDAHGYEEMSAPLINNRRLWVTSGHWAHYKENMFIVPGASKEFDSEDTYAVKPMNCPNAIVAYMHKTRSYKDLPIRYNTVDVIHRKEKSGELNGLFRVQMFRQDDAHIFIREDQIADEMGDIMDIADEIYGTLGMTCKAELSTRPDDFMGDPATWDIAEKELRAILDKKYGAGNYEVNEGDGAFYGPKIDLKMRDALGREWQVGTLQLDFQLPLNFGVKYIDQDGKQKQPVVLHRAIFGSMERFIGILIENFKGAFPFWLSPMQVAIVPIRDMHNDYAKEVASALKKAGVRVEADYADRNMREKIKNFKAMKDPYILVLGDEEKANGTVSLNVRGTNDQVKGLPLQDFIAMCREMNASRSLDLLEKPLK